MANRKSNKQVKAMIDLSTVKSSVSVYADGIVMVDGVMFLRNDKNQFKTKQVR